MVYYCYTVSKNVLFLFQFNFMHFIHLAVISNH